MTQFHHTHWPEDGIAATSSVLKLLNLLVKVQISSGNSSITVMCKCVRGMCDVQYTVQHGYDMRQSCVL